MYKNKEVQPGKEVFVDDDLLIYLYKKIKQFAIFTKDELQEVKAVKK